MRVNLVIPCFDEAQRLRADALAEYAAARDWLRIVLVDDGSRDGTRELLAALQRRDPKHFELLALERNSGKAEAVRRGILHALALPPAPDCVGYWDADLATPLAALDDFAALLEGRPQLEIALGSRVQLLGRRIERHAWRHYLGRVAATLVSAMLGLRVYDTQCGAKLFRVTPGVSALFREPFRTRWIFDVEILARRIRQLPAGGSARELEARILEIPLEVWTDVPGSRLRPADFLTAPLELARIWLHYFGPGSR